MAENIKQRGLNVTVTFDDEKLREIVDDLIINQGLEQVVHCKDCKYYLHTANKCLLTGRYGIFEDYYCNEAEQEEQEHE